jgi:hypothetical protein
MCFKMRSISVWPKIFSSRGEDMDAMTLAVVGFGAVLLILLAEVLARE